MATKFLDASGLKYVISKIKVLLSTKQDKLTFDKTPTANSTNPVTSDGIKTALDEKPSTTGTGASGTWAINISGTAARANLGNWVYKNDNRWYQVMFSQDSQFNYDRDEFTYNPSLNTIKAGTFQGKLMVMLIRLRKQPKMLPATLLQRLMQKRRIFRRYQ